MAKERKKSKKLTAPPTTDCLLICDDVLISQGKKKHNLMGVIGAIVVTQLPVKLGGYVAYMRFSNLRAGQKIKLTLECAETGEVCFEIDAEFTNAKDPLGVYTLVLPLPPFEIPRAGRYLFQATHEGTAFATSPIRIQMVESDGGEP